MSYPIRHLHLHVADLDASVEFYRRVLEMTEKARFAGGRLVFLSDGHGFDLALMAGEEPWRMPPGFHFGCRLADRYAVEDAHRRFGERGASVSDVSHHEGEYTTFVLVDPDGHHIEFYFEPVLGEALDRAGTPARRIATLVPAATEIAFFLGLGDRVVGVSHECDHPFEVASLPWLTGSRVDASQSGKEIDERIGGLVASGEGIYFLETQRIHELAPDLIVTQEQCDVCAVSHREVERLAATMSPAPRIVSLRSGTVAGILAGIEEVAGAAGAGEEGRGRVQGLRLGLEAVRRRAALEPRPRVFCVEWFDPPMLAANWTPELVNLAGGLYPNVAGKTEKIRWESLLEYDPEVLVLMPCGFDLERTAADAVRFAERWRPTTAARTGRVYAADGNAYFNRPGPRILESAEILSEILHGEAGPWEGKAYLRVE